MNRDDFPTLGAAAAALAQGRVSSVELTTEALRRAETTGRDLNAIIALEPETALAAARMADAARAAGRAAGPLAGIPLAHKDMFDRPGFATGCGAGIVARPPAAAPATVIARLEAAGAITIGRLAMSEFAMGPTGHNHHNGRALNPIETRRITGGSSSGSRAAVGGGVVLAALGSDTGGSIRLPAACCGVVGLKPTQGRVSRAGAMPLSFSQDCIGPLARSVEDAMLLLGVIAGPDGRDVTVVGAPGPGVTAPAAAGLRVGFAAGFFDEGLAAPVAQAMETCRTVLASAARSVADVAMPDLDDICELANVVAMSEAAALHLDWLRACPGGYGPQVGARLAQGLAVPAPVYLRALQRRAVMLAGFLDTVFSRCDVLVVPAMPFLPPLAADVDAGAGPAMTAIISDMTRFTRPFSFLGLPAIALPVAAADGLPVSVQVVARPFAEDAAAAIARLLERTLAVGPFGPLAARVPSPATAEALR